MKYTRCVINNTSYHADILLTRENANNLFPHFLVWSTTSEHPVKLFFNKWLKIFLLLLSQNVLFVMRQCRLDAYRCFWVVYSLSRSEDVPVWCGEDSSSESTVSEAVSSEAQLSLLDLRWAKCNEIVLRNFCKTLSLLGAGKKQHNYTYNRESWIVIIMHVGVDKNTQSRMHLNRVQTHTKNRINRKPGDRLFSTQFHSL